MLVLNQTEGGQTELNWPSELCDAEVITESTVVFYVVQ